MSNHYVAPSFEEENETINAIFDLLDQPAVYEGLENQASTEFGEILSELDSLLKIISDSEKTTAALSYRVKILEAERESFLKERVDFLNQIQTLKNQLQKQSEPLPKMAQVNVPATPPKRVETRIETAKNAQSPKRVLLGIDKGLKGSDISLKRAPKFDLKSMGASKAQTYSEKMAAMRKADGEYHTNLQKRSTSFGSDPFTTKATEAPKSTAPKETAPKATAPKATAPKDTDTLKVDYDVYSGNFLSKRTTPRTEVTRSLVGKTIYKIPDLLKVVKAPEYSAPDVKGDLVVVGIVASKSAPIICRTLSLGKYIILTITDLKWELDVYLHGDGFQKFNKITPGTVISILNPNIRPPTRSRAATGKFTMSVMSGKQVIMEIGTARDAAWCSSLKKDGSLCRNCVDGRRTKFCDYHTNMVYTEGGKSKVWLERQKERELAGKLGMEMDTPKRKRGDSVGGAGAFKKARGL